jgi:apolipoprotein N-acyltransferase
LVLTAPRRVLLAALSGLLFFAAFPPLQWHWLGWIALWPLFVAVMGARLRLAALLGLVTTLCFYGLSVYWVYTVFRVHGKLSVLQAAGVQAVLLLYLSTYRIGFCVLLAWISRRNRTCAPLAAPFLWTAMEFIFVRTPHFSLPWNLLGYAATEQLGVLQLATVTGVYGLSFLMAAYAALLASLPHDRGSRRRLGVTETFYGMTALILAAQVAGYALPAPAARYAARLVQPNLPQSDYANWYEKHAEDLDRMERFSLLPAGAPSGSLTIWPEVPAPFYLSDPRFAVRVQRIAQANRGYFLTGVVEWRPASDTGPGDRARAMQMTPRNSAVLLGPAGNRQYAYDKIHLVPFGEYVPLRRWLSFADSLTGEVSGFTSGRDRNTGHLPGGTFATVICFEAIFPGEVRRFVNEPDCPDPCLGAQLLINISNDAWFGRVSGPDQHLEMARLRAVENRRWLLRATNNGHTVAIDPYGRIRARLPVDQAAALDAPYDFRSDRTVYTIFGDWWAWLCLLASLAMALRPPAPESSVPAKEAASL